MKKKISKGYHLLEHYKPTSIVATIVPLGWVLICIADELQLQHTENTVVDGDNIRAYLNPNRKNHRAVRIANLVALLFLAIFKLM